MEISPKSHDFGTVDIPCTDSVEITLSSVGEGDLTISELDYAAGSLLQLDTTGIELPLTLAPGESATVTVNVNTVGPLTDFGTLTVTSDDPKGDKIAEQTASADGRLVMDSFYEPGIVPVDILFMIDQSCSMETLADDNIRQGMPAFINELQNVRRTGS